jgi:hypothetical protein
LAAPTLKDLVPQYRAEGLSLFPLPWKSKRDDSFKWGVFQERLPTDAEIGKWFNGHPSNIAVVCGQVSGGLVVVEFDNPDYFNEFDLAFMVRTGERIDEFTRVTKGKRGPHVWLRVKGITKSKKTPKCEIRSDGNYIVVPPSVHPDGPQYQFLNDLPIREIDSLLEVGIDLDQERPAASTNQPGWVTRLLLGVGEGGRNDAAIRLAGYFRNTQPIDVTETIMQSWNTKNLPPLPDRELLTTIRSAYNLPEHAIAPVPAASRGLSHAKVLQWISLASGAFNVRQIWGEMNIMAPEDKTHLRQILHRMTETGIVAKTNIDGTYRKVDNDKEPLDWQSAEPNKYLPLVLPFNIHEVCRVYPQSIIIVAGSKNEGKTAFLMSCIMPNVGKFQVDFYNSETGPEQLKQRFEPLNVPRPAPFNTYKRYDNFADVIDPTHLSIIDYLDTNSEVYLVGAEIDNIFRKITTGCAIIGLQKPPPSVTWVKGEKKVIDRDLAYGGGFTAKRAVIYISLSSHRLKLVYVKTPVNPKVNPNNMTWSYHFDDNGYFTGIQRYYGED